MNHFSMQKQRGFTLMEILLSLAILLVIGSTISGILTKYKITKGLDVALETVSAAFAKGYFDSISSRNGLVYGVHISTTTLTVFSGGVYSAVAADNTVFQFEPGIEISSTTLAGGGSDVIFSRLSGTTTQPGTFMVRSTKNTTISRTLTIQGTGTLTQ